MRRTPSQGDRGNSFGDDQTPLVLLLLMLLFGWAGYGLAFVCKFLFWAFVLLITVAVLDD